MHVAHKIVATACSVPLLPSCDAYSSVLLLLFWQVQCSDGYSHDSSKAMCIQPETTTIMHTVRAICAGFFLACCGVLVIFLIRKNPSKAKKIMGSVMRMAMDSALMPK